MTGDELVTRFAAFDDWEERYAYLIELGRKLPPMSPADKTEETKVRGCVSQVWLVMSQEPDGRWTITADSDAHIVRGLIAVVRTVFSGKTSAEIREADIDRVFKDIGLAEQLTPNRRNGFWSMVERIRKIAQI